ncbi:MAG: amylo-alpha-1,6-glucosidase [Candidatus Krumholzibacteria bacterium]|nr:amylo-alpha-1,6-glucosidase [Candidatus Krumholzibacteria bacterium]
MAMRYAIAVSAALILAAGCAGEIRTWSAKEMAEDITGARLVRETAEEAALWEIRVEGGASREYIVTNGVAAHFSCETNAPHSRSYHGLFCSMFEYLDSWELGSGDRTLDPGSVTIARAYPRALYRWYGDERIMERIVMPGGENGLVVRFSGMLADTCSLTPWIDMRFIWDVPRPQYRIFWEERNNALLLSRADDPFGPDRPKWIAVTADLDLDFVPGETFRETVYPKDQARRAMGKTFPFSPGRFVFETDPGDLREVVFAFGLGKTEDEAIGQAQRLLPSVTPLSRRPFPRPVPPPPPFPQPVALEGEGEDRPETPLPMPEGTGREHKALRWARASMDNLIMDQRGRGIYAGFHWFPNYWGRDSFICLPGACLATGRLETAREILVSFMQYQQTDADSPRLGRMPNIVNPDDLQYAGIDGTWWYVRAAWKYFMASGDETYLIEAYPNIRLAIEGALGKAVDAEGFLTHGDGETWMDAGGEANPYSPRGDRAVEVQALFHHGLLAGAAWARTLSVVLEEADLADDPGAAAAAAAIDAAELAALADRWTERAGLLARHFRERFWWEEWGYLRDHLDRDGSVDGQIRPNALLALWVWLDTLELFGGRAALGAGGVPGFAILVEWDQFVRIVATARETVILPHGVTSLDPDDSDFKPQHLNLDRYYYDAAYHNGDVWEWLTGPAITCLIAAGEERAARELYAPLIDEILDEACVGSLREIQDGARTPGKEEYGGATSQAWSLAEFIRVAIEHGMIETGDGNAKILDR